MNDARWGEEESGVSLSQGQIPVTFPLTGALVWTASLFTSSCPISDADKLEAACGKG